MSSESISSLLILADASLSIRSLQLWIILGACMLLLLLVVWQMVTEARKHRPSKAAQEAKAVADQIITEARERAEAEAAARLKDADIRAREVVLQAKAEFEKSVEGRRQEMVKEEERLTQKEDKVDQKLEWLEKRLADLDQREAANKAAVAELQLERQALAERVGEHQRELERIAGLTESDARKELLDQLECALESERGQLIRRFQEENRRHLEAQGQRIMIDAMQKYAGDCAYERTTSTIPLANEEMKGRIIGREGRNIRTIEAATGASILIDDTPQAVVISCFDPVRREIARQTMEKLVSDGRIHPARVEDVVQKTQKEMENEINRVGRETVEKLGLVRVKDSIINLLGRLKYRYSFSQNVLAHSIEVASMMGDIAANLGLDENRARRAGLFHDLGKAVDHEVEGSHAVIGADLLRNAGEDKEIINAVEAHHEDVEKTSLLAILVQICDTLSAARPGARSESTELYLKRLEDLETIGNSFPGVENCFAIQAGRELRVIVKPEKVSESAAAILARDMALRIENEVHFAGQIRISVIRETRAIEYAK